jgi:hypothetical protein
MSTFAMMTSEGHSGGSRKLFYLFMVDIDRDCLYKLWRMTFKVLTGPNVQGVRSDYVSR